MKNIFVIVFVLTVFSGYSQGNLNDYKYIIVPKKFDAFKKENQYRTSTLVKFLFTQDSYNALVKEALLFCLLSEK